MIRVTNDKGQWAINAKELMKQVLGGEPDERIRALTRTIGYGWGGPKATRLELQVSGVVYPPVKRWVAVDGNGQIDENKVRAKYNELLALLPGIEAAKAERIAAHEVAHLERVKRDLASVEEYLPC